MEWMGVSGWEMCLRESSIRNLKQQVIAVVDKMCLWFWRHIYDIKIQVILDTFFTKLYHNGLYTANKLEHMQILFAIN